ncbi:peptidoglycan-binding protein [Achromobacter seleniivolatilans]|uniref:peptidoglycan-binding protein n=1 Tax=Achromobacter seleniivolatilans TaxID=3047478 RepID=UPI003529C2B2
MIRIQASVGQGGLNRAADVRVVQRALNAYRRRYRYGREIPETGLVSSDVVQTIQDFQSRLGVAPSGRWNG